MNDAPSDRVAVGSPPSAEMSDRVICVVARDVLSLERRDVGLDGFLAAVWRGRWLLLICVFVFCLAAVAYSYLASKWYSAETVLIAASQKSLGGLAGELGGLGMLTSLAGINLGEGSNTDEALGVLKSNDFARQFIQDQKLLHVLLWNAWDAKAGRWKQSDPRRQPDIRDAVSYFDSSVLSVNQDSQTGLVTLSIRWTDPQVAAAWANMLVDRLNAELRARELALGEENIDYLEKELASTSQMSVKVAIAQLIETELQKLMVARSDKDFAFRVIDHAEVPKISTWPKRGILATLGILGGGLFGLMAIFTLELWKRRSHWLTLAK